MPTGSKEIARHEDHGPVESWHEEVGGHAIEFVYFKQDIDSTPMLKGLPGDECHRPHWGYVRMRMRTFIFGLVLAIACAPSALAADGALDRSFGAGGQVNIGGGFDPSRGGTAAVVRLSDGTGRYVVAAGEGSAVRFIRLNPNGTPDASFGTNGASSVNADVGSLTPRFVTLSSLVVQPDGKLVAGGTYTEGPQTVEGFSLFHSYGVLARVLPDGRPDPDFGPRGLNGGRGGLVGGPGRLGGLSYNDLDKKLSAVGTSGGSWMVARFLVSSGGEELLAPNGARVLTQPGSLNGVILETVFAGGIATQRLLAPGSAENRPSFALARLRYDGQLDSSFASGGIAFTRFPDPGSRSATAPEDAALSVVRTSDGGYVAAGGAATNVGFDFSPDKGQWMFAVARYTPTGAPDTSFHGDGKILTDFASSTSERANAVGLDSSGRAIVAGGATAGPTHAFALARYTQAGALDNSFDGDGKVVTPIFTPAGDASPLLAPSLSVEPGRIVVASLNTGAVTLERYVFAEPPKLPAKTQAGLLHATTLRALARARVLPMAFAADRPARGHLVASLTTGGRTVLAGRAALRFRVPGAQRVLVPLTPAAIRALAHAHGGRIDVRTTIGVRWHHVWPPR